MRFEAIWCPAVNDPDHRDLSFEYTPVRYTTSAATAGIVSERIQSLSHGSALPAAQERWRCNSRPE